MYKPVCVRFFIIVVFVVVKNEKHLSNIEVNSKVSDLYVHTLECSVTIKNKREIKIRGKNSLYCMENVMFSKRSKL